MTDPVHRAVIRYIREEYGVNPGQPHRGAGRHPILEFEYGGSRRIITVPNHGHTLATIGMKLQDVRRELGPPPPKPERKKMQLRDMLPPATAAQMTARVPELAATITTEATVPDVATAYATHAGACRVARYKPTQLRIFLPIDVVDRLFGTDAAILTTTDDSHWLLTPRRGGKRPSFHGYGATNEHQIEAPCRDGGLFGMSPSEWTEVDGGVMVYSDPALRVAVTKRSGSPRPAAPQLRPATVDPRERLLACLREIRAIEALGTHLLLADATEDGNRFFWEPLPGKQVRLED